MAVLMSNRGFRVKKKAVQGRCKHPFCLLEDENDLQEAKTHLYPRNISQSISQSCLLASTLHSVRVSLSRSGADHLVASLVS